MKKESTNKTRSAIMTEWTIYYKVRFSKFDKFDGRFSDNTLRTATVKARNEKDAKKKFLASQVSIVRGLSKRGKVTTHKVRTRVQIVRIFTGDGVRRFKTWENGKANVTRRAVRVLKPKMPRWMR
jgi:hypothetical protein